MFGALMKGGTSMIDLGAFGPLTKPDDYLNEELFANIKNKEAFLKSENL